jgi:hypothetical protein
MKTLMEGVKRALGLVSPQRWWCAWTGPGSTGSVWRSHALPAEAKKELLVSL